MAEARTTGMNQGGTGDVDDEVKVRALTAALIDESVNKDDARAIASNASQRGSIDDWLQEKDPTGEYQKTAAAGRTKLDNDGPVPDLTNPEDFRN